MRLFFSLASWVQLRLARKSLIAIGLLLSGTVGCARADALGTEIRIIAPPGWASTPPFSALLGESPFPTLQYVSTDGHSATMILTLLPQDLLGFAVTDRPTLAKFGLVAARPHFSSSEPPPMLTEFTMGNGIGACATMRSSVLPNNSVASAGHGFTTIAVALLESKYLVHCAVFHNGNDTPEFVQAFQTLCSATAQIQAHRSAR